MPGIVACRLGRPNPRASERLIVTQSWNIQRYSIHTTANYTTCARRTSSVLDDVLNLAVLPLLGMVNEEFRICRAQESPGNTLYVRDAVWTCPCNTTPSLGQVPLRLMICIQKVQYESASTMMYATTQGQPPDRTVLRDTLSTGALTIKSIGQDVVRTPKLLSSPTLTDRELARWLAGRLVE
ncbi:hypothetical protein MYCTH_2112063 [Thermothelomyces thermophilus ATCC 42464]|uniref:Uncharacterized protein n=1 Tax=Thermothelomyces thermophilus (strain ATCC 42464 / BCRC 31852 / DSM 1799) TaxID=573729 RepID=G2QK29_THET4|nr:uncharacterized protein MYCTH_2112063 [Thermothelomyces thermophilus ATCC 42464]AEO59935.1 hypothetical protein MYCTH_2112063 [Thermothelomyces thermophilus ATCC 42464]